MTMTTVRTDRSLTRYDWEVDTLERRGGMASVQKTARYTTLRVTDRQPTASHPSWESSIQAWLSADGTVTVRSHCAPPALLVSATGARLLPPTPDSEETTSLDEGDVLLLCSAAVLDSVPTGLGEILGWSPRRVGAQEPGALLEHLMADAEQGAAALIRCVDTHGTPATGPAPGTTPTEEDR